jgi:anti-anti-sigma factor
MEDRDDEFDVNIVWLEGTALVALSGEWDLYSKERLHDMMSTIGTLSDVVVDVRGATFFDSSALGELVAFYKRLKEAGRRFEVITTNSNMEHLLEMTGLRAILEPTPDRLAYLQEHLPITPS